MKLTYRTLLLLGYCLLSVLSLKQPVYADGALIIRPDPYSDRWDYGDESAQHAYINYEHGVQKMIIAIDIASNSYSNAVWIFPVPALPEKVTIDVVHEMPDLMGEDVYVMAEKTLKSNRNTMISTQIYPIPIQAILGNLTGAGIAVEDVTLSNTGLGGNYEAPKRDVTVHESITKEGVTTELVTAKTSTGLYLYLNEKGLDIKKNSITAFDNYIGEDYSFVVSWLASSTRYPTRYYDNNYEGTNYSPTQGISSEEDRRITDVSSVPDRIDPVEPENPPQPTPSYYRVPFSPPPPPRLSGLRGVFVTFPTKKLYYPLLPTSVYGSKKVPASIRILGHVSPVIYEDIEAFSEVNYYFDEYASLPEDFYKETSRNSRAEDIKYTKVEIEAPSKLLTQDLWIKTRAPFFSRTVSFIGLHSFWTFAITMVICSAIAGLIAGSIIFGNSLTKGKMVLVGLFNCLTLFGLIFAIAVVKTRDPEEDASALLSEIKSKKYFLKKRLGQLLFLINLPFLIIACFYLIFGISNILEHIVEEGSIPMLAIIPFLIWYGSSKLKHVQEEDRHLFEELKKRGYSVLTLHPADPRKLYFIPVFSIIFLLNTVILETVLQAFL